MRIYTLRLPVDGLAVLLNELAGLLGGGYLGDDLLNGEESKAVELRPASAGDVLEAKRSEHVSMASHMNCRDANM